MSSEKEPQDYPELFPLAPLTRSEKPAPRIIAPNAALHTLHKAELIAEYLRLFVLVTKHGTYLDGFAGPQDPVHLTSWAAKLALDVEPRFLRHFVLCELDARKIPALNALKAAHSDRDVLVCAGNFNELLDEVLAPIAAREATFCLLDQHTFECEWVSVVRLARHKEEGYKIELFYFLAQ